MEAIVEFHGFKDNDNTFIVKELAIVGKSYRTQIVFKPPYDFNFLNNKMKRTARWLSRHFHHIKWEEGDIVYSEELIQYLCKPFAVLHTKGLEKANFLRKFHSNVKEIDERLNVNNIECTACILPQHNKKIMKIALYFLRFFTHKKYSTAVDDHLPRQG